MPKSSEYRDESERLLIAQHELCRHYGWNPNFMADLQEFIETHRSELDRLARTAQKSEPLLAEAKRIADRWGLQAPWAPRMLTDDALLNHSRRWGGMMHRIEVTPNPSFQYRFPLNGLITIHPLLTLNERTIRITIEYAPSTETRKAARARAIQELDRQLEAIEQRFEAEGLVKREHKQKLETHVHWLYLAACPDSKKKRPLNFTEIADWYASNNEDIWEHQTEDAIRKAVHSLATSLQIQLPQKRGRPNA